MTEPRIVTLGCRLNAFESEVIRGEASAAGLGDAVIVNTCAVTTEAVRQARQTIRRLRRERPNGRIIVTGCAAQLAPDTFAAMPEVDQVLGNVEKLHRAHFGESDRKVAVSDIMTVKETATPFLRGFDSRTRAFVQVQQGCDHRCTFCIIPFARGPNRGFPAGRIVDQVRALCENGYAEVVLTGVDICSYGADLEGHPTLGELVRRVLTDVPDLKRLRLSSLDPAAMDDGLLRVLADEPRMMPHLHLSLQSADDTILKRMKRRHSRAQAMAAVERARRARPDVVFGADLIAGFPTETDEMFGRTLDAVEDLGLTYLHVFPFSPRPGTPAARMPQVPGPAKRQRAAALREAGDRAQTRFFESRIGSTTEILVEQGRDGRCPHYAPVSLDFDAEPGAIVAARITGASHDRLTGGYSE